VITLADWLPAVTLIAALGWLLWRYFDPMQLGYPHPGLTDLVLLPLAITLIVLVILHLLIAVILPLRWAAIRDQDAWNAAARADSMGFWRERAGRIAWAREPTVTFSGTLSGAHWFADRELNATVSCLAPPVRAHGDRIVRWPLVNAGHRLHLVRIRPRVSQVDRQHVRHAIERIFRPRRYAPT